MFTGIIQDLGRVAGLEAAEGGARLSVDWSSPRAVARGESVAVSGVCLTALEDSQGRMRFDLSAETLKLTTLGSLKAGAKVNLEKALRAGDSLGGHLVAGHVDGIGTLQEVMAQGEGRELTFEAPAAMAVFLADKGSVAVNGVSLTPIRVRGSRFSVALIPHTLEATDLGALKAGDKVNLEADQVARYVARQLGLEKGKA